MRSFRNGRFLGGTAMTNGSRSARGSRALVRRGCVRPVREVTHRLLMEAGAAGGIGEGDVERGWHGFCGSLCSSRFSSPIACLNDRHCEAVGSPHLVSNGGAV